MTFQERIEVKQNMLVKLNQQIQTETDKAVVWRLKNRCDNLTMDIKSLEEEIQFH